ncbi:MAG: hypothetical protein WDM85_00635 [Caulobacteraceae bacterium]
MPILGVLMCVFLLLSLVKVEDTRNFFLWYMGLGVVVYFIYGLWNSKLGKSGSVTLEAELARWALIRLSSRAADRLEDRRRCCRSKRALPALKAALAAKNAAVLVAPPGAGKTTVTPLALLGEQWAAGGKLIVLEPRRIAARAAAERMAATLGEKVGEDRWLPRAAASRISARTRIEVVTEGVFTG